MAEIEIINRESKSVGKAEMPDEIFAAQVRTGLLHEVVRNHLANLRKGNASTKTRGLVRGGGRKPYRQKGSGRARAGSIRSPLWKGGGTVFGPQPRDYSYRIPKKAKWVAMNSALSSKFRDGEISVVDSIEIAEPRTRLVKEFIEGLGIKGSVLIIIPEKNEALELGARNLPGVSVARVSELNVYSVLSHDRLLISKDAVEKMKEAYLG